MAGTLLSAVRTTLVEQLAVLPALADVNVSYQWNGSGGRERIWTRRARFSHSPEALRSGRNFRQEVGRFDVVVLVEGVGLAAQETADRACDLSLAVEEFVADRKQGLGLAGMQTLLVDGDGELVEAFNDNGTLAELSLPVRYTARLT